MRRRHGRRHRVDHGGGRRERPVHQDALQTVDLLAERGKQDREAAAGAHGLGETEAALATGDGEDPLAPPPIVHQESDHPDAVVQPAEIVPVEHRQQIVHRFGPASHQAPPEALRAHRQRVGQDPLGVRLQGELQELVHRPARGGVVGGDQAADAAADHGVQRNAQLDEAGQHADVGGATEPPRPQDDCGALPGGRRAAASRHAATGLM